jgi:hypothetical protein
MKSLLTAVLFSLITFVATSSIAAPTIAGPVEIWVSPNGEDSSLGSKESPFATLERAHKELHKRIKEKKSSLNIIVYLENGTYRLDKTIVFDPNIFDGPNVTFRAAPGATPVISGAVQVKNKLWTLHDQSKNIHKATVCSGSSKRAKKECLTRQLYVNGKRATRARTSPNHGNLPGFSPKPKLPSTPLPPLLPLPPNTKYLITGSIDYSIPSSTKVHPSKHPSMWTNVSDIEAVVQTQWKMMSVPLEKITQNSENNGSIKLQQPGWTNANLYFSTKPISILDPKIKCIPDGPGIWSFWKVNRFENAYEFLDEKGEWYLNKHEGALYYIPRTGEDMSNAVVELPILETLIKGHGTNKKPIANLHFEGITFAHATWTGPSNAHGYVSDQSGFHVVGDEHYPNITGHVKDVTRTPGNLSFKYAKNITFKNNIFKHLGAVGLDFDIGSHNNQIVRNHFTDISSAAIQLGGVARDNVSTSHYPTKNKISNNRIHKVGVEYVDAAGIFIGFSSYTDVSHNAISWVPWSGIAIGWGWGLLDESGFPGLGCAKWGEWGNYKPPPTSNSHNTIRFNRISHFLENRWDGGAIYTTGQQGQSMNDPLIIEGNVAYNKRTEAGGNVFYTDGGSRYIKLINNASYDNPIGTLSLRPKLPPNLILYGSDSGGCRTYGHIHYKNNYWLEGLIPITELVVGDQSPKLEKLINILSIFKDGSIPFDPTFDPYSKQGFFDICPYTHNGKTYPINMKYSKNHKILWGEWDVPHEILQKAGIQPKK